MIENKTHGKFGSRLNEQRSVFSLNNIPIQKCHPFKISRPKIEVLIKHYKRQWPDVEDTARVKLSADSGVSALWF